MIPNPITVSYQLGDGREISIETTAKIKFIETDMDQYLSGDISDTGKLEDVI